MYVQDYFTTQVPVAVVDFSCYDEKAALDLGTYLLRWPVKWYIYLSTDSVYEVSDKRHLGPSKESDAVRPTDPQTIDNLKSMDPYAHHKLAGEEAIVSVWEGARQQKQDHPKPWDYVFIRVPDVMGPRDTSSYKWWWYQVLIKVSRSLVHMQPCGIKQGGSPSTSFYPCLMCCVCICTDPEEGGSTDSHPDSGPGREEAESGVCQGYCSGLGVASRP